MSTDLEWSIENREPDRGFLVAKCHVTSMGECRWPLWRKPAGGTMWQWDGNVERPTIMPSIDCKGGCGRHFTMIDGVPS